MLSRKRIAVLCATFFLLLLQPLSASFAKSGNLGLVLDVLPSSDPEIQKLTAGQSLWFVIPPGESKLRQVRITSSADIPEVVSLSIGYLNRVDGVATIDESKPSEVRDWANFSKNDFIIAPHQSQLIDFSFRIPSSADIGVHEAFLYVSAGPISTVSKDEYKLNQRARIASPIFLGVGSSDQIATDFEIADVNGVIVNGVKNIKISFKNTGKTPLNLSGDVQLSSLDFKDLSAGPLAFNSLVIRPGVDAFVLVPTGDQVNPGNWKILVKASQLSKTKTKEFTKNFTFKDSNKWLTIGLRALAAIFFGAILYICIRVIRKPRVRNSENEVDGKKVALTPQQGSAHSAPSQYSISDDELEALLDSLLKKRKAPAKKAAKKVTKKAPAKKVAKKASAKRVAKKAPAKKAPAKKVAKKAPPRKAR